MYQVWHLRLTIHCLADAGNMLDCSCLAGVVALRHFRRPEVEVVGDEVTIVRGPSSHPASDTLTHLNAAPPLRTRARPALDAPHALLPHLRVLP